MRTRTSQRKERRGGFRRGAIAGAFALAACIAPRASAAQEVVRLPFGVGERLTYKVRVARWGTVGRGAMWVEGPVDVRGSDTYVLRFDVQARVGLLKAVDRTESWLDPRRMAALRFQKHERHPFSSNDQAVEMFPDQRRWEAAGGATGESPTDTPLDELSFIYFIRTLPLVPDTVYQFNRHFEADRNPVTVRVLGRERVETGAGEFPAVVVEMRVKDARRYRGEEGVIRLHLTDDARRLPVRIESRMPVVGTAVLTLETRTDAPERLAIRAR